MSSRPRAILHLDLDAFYAAAEVLDDPRLRGLPVIVAGRSRRGVVCAASYEARRFGVHSAMPTARARQLCPEGVFLPPRFERYGELSERVFGIYRRYTPLVEPLSLDEAYLDVTASAALHGPPRDIAVELKRSVRQEVGLSVSAGAAETKLCAKIASDLSKPDGLLVVPPGGAREFLAPLPVGRLWGVGKVTERALAGLGIATIGDLASAPEQVLARAFGHHAREMRAFASGEDPREVVADEEAKSVGAEETFERDLAGEEALRTHLLGQAERVARRLRAAGLEGRTVTVKVKYADFTLVTRRRTLGAPTSDGRAIYDAALEALGRADLSRRVRLTGVSVSGFAGERSRQLDLFAGGEGRGAPARAAAPGEPPHDRIPDERRRARLNAAVDALAERFGEGVVRPADLAARKGEESD